MLVDTGRLLPSLLVTLSAKGAVGATSGLPAVEVPTTEIVDATGASDAFSARGGGARACEGRERGCGPPGGAA